MKITRSTISGLPPAGNARRTFWDEATPGFGITQHVGGKIVFVAKFRVGGRQVMKTLGAYPTITPERARQVFGEFKAHGTLGIDLSAKIKSERRASETIADLCDDYIARHLPRKRPKSAYEDTRKIENHIRPKFGTKRVTDVTRADIEKAHADMRATPIEANRLLALLSKMFSIAVLDGRRADNPAKGVSKYPEHPRERYLSEEESARLDATFESLEAQHFETVSMLRLIRYTGARKGEAVDATWGQFDLESGVWTKPAALTKQKKSHRVPIEPRAIAVLSVGLERY